MGYRKAGSIRPVATAKTFKRLFFFLGLKFYRLGFLFRFKGIPGIRTGENWRYLDIH